MVDLKCLVGKYDTYVEEISYDENVLLSVSCYGCVDVFPDWDIPADCIIAPPNLLKTIRL